MKVIINKDEHTHKYFVMPIEEPVIFNSHLIFEISDNLYAKIQELAKEENLIQNELYELVQDRMDCLSERGKYAYMG